MTPAEVAAKLRAFNEWRRGDEDIPQFDPREIGEVIDAAVEMIDRLEAAEKSDAESLAMFRKARDERDALRAALRHEADCVEAAKADVEVLRAELAGLRSSMEFRTSLIGRTEAERDALRQALQGLLDALPSATTHPAINAARAAIARATGEQP